jgi:hypothetical protein
MFIAKLNTDGTILVGEHQTFFPNTSFTIEGPTDAFLNEHGCVKAQYWINYDTETKKLIATEPFLDNGVVYVVKAVDKTAEEIEQEKLQQLAANKVSRSVAYREEADPLFFKAQRGEATMEEWLAKVEEIKQRY